MPNAIDPHREQVRQLIAEGWRFIPHSYAAVYQWQLLQMLDRPALRILHRDLPYCDPQWRQVPGLFDATAEQRLKQIPLAGSQDTADAVFRVGFPINLAALSGVRTFVYGTAEFAVVPPEHIAGGMTLAQACAASDATIIAPSHWSARGFIYSGAPFDRVHVVPHGIDPGIFSPATEEMKVDLRRRWQWDGFAFLHVGAMTGNKGVPLLLKAFAEVLRSHPHCRLVLKGMDGLYRSEAMSNQAMQELTPEERARAQARILYYGRTFSFAEMAALYRAADCYVSPYRAEGFNLPVLEAAACGVPIVCTRGGPTDDFTTDDFALRIDSKLVNVPLPGGVHGQALEADFDHLLRCMVKVVEDKTFRTKARQAGPDLVRTEFTWQRAVDKLLSVVFPA
jgi:glycosyltransferase involved in cell wall biosynthesis